MLSLNLLADTLHIQQLSFDHVYTTGIVTGWVETLRTESQSAVDSLNHLVKIGLTEDNHV